MQYCKISPEYFWNILSILRCYVGISSFIRLVSSVTSCAERDLTSSSFIFSVRRRIDGEIPYTRFREKDHFKGNSCWASWRISERDTERKEWRRKNDRGCYNPARFVSFNFFESFIFLIHSFILLFSFLFLLMTSLFKRVYYSDLQLFTLSLLRIFL